MFVPKIALPAALLLASALAWSQPAPGHAGMNHDAKGASVMMESMRAMNDQMASAAMTGDPDIDFAIMMRIHHLGAVDMATAELKTGRSPQMRKLAEDIIAAQKHEIAIFEKFLADKRHPVDKKKK
ncbi:MAG: hypothetical protein JWQ72_1690 [Polaromonas sp.]|nr:hypothetical protein [Polaromonas sp.]